MDEAFPPRRRQVELQTIGTDGILLDQQGRAHLINASAVRVWQLIDGSRTVEEIATAFGAGYGMPMAAVHDDVRTILATFRDLGLLEAPHS